MKMNKYKTSVKFHSSDGETLSVVYSNRGDPYSQGIDIELDDTDNKTIFRIYLEQHEALQLAKLITDLYGQVPE